MLDLIVYYLRVERIPNNTGHSFKARKKFKLTQEQLNRWNDIFDNATVLISPKLEIDFPRDQKDAKFLACAIEANADFLITGDLDFTEAQSLVQTTIVSVSLFKKLVCDLLT
ncbi:hypothetical protein CAL7716_008320 [Calothrix sp. PCC 7716]|nr:hypothetical protein CAL7716_008320 [Calothrix sp. PCC 7716]